MPRRTHLHLWSHLYATLPTSSPFLTPFSLLNFSSSLLLSLLFLLVHFLFHAVSQCQGRLLMNVPSPVRRTFQKQRGRKDPRPHVVTAERSQKKNIKIFVFFCHVWYLFIHFSFYVNYYFLHAKANIKISYWDLFIRLDTLELWHFVFH